METAIYLNNFHPFTRNSAKGTGYASRPYNPGISLSWCCFYNFRLEQPTINLNPVI